MEKELQKHIEDFLNEFMLIEDKEGEHIMALKHYREVFNEVIPK